MNYEEILTSKLQQIIQQHRSFNRFKSIDDEKVFISERNQELIFHYDDDEKVNKDIKVKQSCYISSGQANLKTKIYFWDANTAKWVVTKKNIKFLEDILDTIETFDNTVEPARLEKLGQMSLFGEVM